MGGWVDGRRWRMIWCLVVGIERTWEDKSGVDSVLFCFWY